MVSLASNALTGQEAVEDVIPGYTSGDDSDADDRINRWINQGSGIVQSLAGRNFYHKTSHEERVESRRTKNIWVTDHVPIDSDGISKIEWDDGDTTDEVDSGDYHVIDADKGQIRMIAGLWSSTARRRGGVLNDDAPGTEEVLYKVTYDGGYITVNNAGTRNLPWDIEEAVLDYVVMKEAQHGHDSTIKKLSMGEGSVTFGGRRVPQSMAAVVDRYRLNL